MPSTSTRNRRSWPYALVALALLVYLVLPDRPAPSFQDLAQKMPQIPQNLPEWVEHFPQVPWRPRPPKKNPFAAPDATQQKIPKKSLKLREEIEKQTDHLTQHSPTLTFSHIYVVSLPSRQDRRQTMSRLASALGLKFTFIDAEPKDSDMITWIGERVFETRRKKRRPLAKAMGLPVEEIGGVAVGSPWLAMDGQKGEAGTLALPSLKDARWQDLTWTEFLEQEETKGLASGTSSPLLRPLNASFDVVEALWDPTEARDTRQTNSAVLSTWHSHVKAIKTMRANDDESALVLEDDVDMEWDIESVWAAVHRRLPPEWELVYLGSCWGRESTYPTKLHPSLFHSESPRCLHGYSLSRAGYTKLLDLLTDPWIAYQVPIDVAIPNLIESRFISSFTVDPPLIMQAKISASDIQQGKGSAWRGLLADSTLDRIHRDEGAKVPMLTWEEADKDAYVYKPNVLGQTY